jgi:uncharacterized hydrophobic protein (TIGR00271 family)
MSKKRIENDTNYLSGRRGGFRELLHKMHEMFRDLFNLTEGADFDGAARGIKEDISFKGHKLWVLIFSIFIASIGLDANSTAVIIGAMLISPLMGPIIGVGYSLGVYDIDLLKNAARNLIVATGIAITTSMLYFLVSPFSTAQSELLARTNPTMLDVLIAFFGGLAGIVGSTRKEKDTVIIPGVAIATALMPPLCTAGFGLATGQWNFFFGAFYLYLINSIFIALATFLMVRSLPFPRKKFLNPAREKRVKQSITIITIIVMIPSIITAISVVRENNYNKNATRFINEYFQKENSEVINYKINYHTRDSSQIEVFIFGSPYSDIEISALRQKMPEIGLSNTKLIVFQNNTESTQELVGAVSSQVKMNVLEDLYNKNEALLSEKSQQIDFLTNRLLDYENPQIPQIANELSVLFPEIEKISIDKAIFASPGDEIPDTTYLAIVQWKEGTGRQVIRNYNKTLKELLQARLKKENIEIMTYRGIEIEESK